MSIYQIEVTTDYTHFLSIESKTEKNIAKGLGYITAGFKVDLPLSGFHLETMIYRSEELLENELNIKPIHGEISLKKNQLTKDLIDTYFNDVGSLTNEMIEYSFNTVAESFSYGPVGMNLKQLEILALLVLIREASHHLKITVINLQLTI